MYIESRVHVHCGSSPELGNKSTCRKITSTGQQENRWSYDGLTKTNNYINNGSKYDKEFILWKLFRIDLLFS